MCGRYALEISTETLSAETLGAEVLSAAFGLEAQARVASSYNIVPSSSVAFVGADGLAFAHWGWTTHGFNQERQKYQINARSETLAQRPSFRDDIVDGRCLIPASAFYEWQHKGERKGQPYAVRPKNNNSNNNFFAFAGLQRQGNKQRECVIITTEANESLAPIHPREPVMLSPDVWSRWLHSEPKEALSLLTTSLPSSVEVYPISREINNIKNDSAHLLDKINLPPMLQQSLF